MNFSIVTGSLHFNHESPAEAGAIESMNEAAHEAKRECGETKPQRI